MLTDHQILYSVARNDEFGRAFGFSGQQHASIAEYLGRNTKARTSQEFGLHVQLLSKNRQVVIQAAHGRDRFAPIMLAFIADAFPSIINHDSEIFIDER